MNEGRLHLLAFGMAHTVSTDSILNAISDPVYAIQSNQFQIPNPLSILAAYASGVTLQRARINTPTTKLRGFPQIIPNNAALLPITNQDVCDFRNYPLQVMREENLEVDTTTITATENEYAGLWVTDAPVNLNVNYRDVRFIRFTATVTYVAFSWSALAQITLQDQIEGGSYAVYGMQCSQATLIFARLQFQNQYMRPGCLGNAALGARQSPIFRGELGLWGIFNTYSLPQIECIGDTVGAATIEGYLQIAKVGPFVGGPIR